MDVWTAVFAESRTVGKLGCENFARFDGSASSDRSELSSAKKKKKVKRLKNIEFEKLLKKKTPQHSKT